MLGTGGLLAIVILTHTAVLQARFPQDDFQPGLCMLQVQLRHNKRKSAAIKELLGKGNTLPSSIKQQFGAADESMSGSDDGTHKPIYDVLASLLGGCEGSSAMGEASGLERPCSTIGESTDEAASLLAELAPALARG